MAELHSITGLYNDLFRMNIFAGHMNVQSSKRPSNIEGFLIDEESASSKITGKIDTDSLEFTKTYRLYEDQKDKSIFYNFKLENGIWKGEYDIPCINKKGRAVCKTELWVDGLGFKTYDSYNPNSWEKFMIDGLVKQGLLKIVKDPKTGEKSIQSKWPEPEDGIQINLA